MYDITISNGLIYQNGLHKADIGISNGKIKEISHNISPGKNHINAAGKYVLPGGIDSHCHIEQQSGLGMWTADDFFTATRSAAFGGTTAVMSFAAQRKGDNLHKVIDDYAQRAKNKAVIDYAFHLIVSDPSEDVLNEQLPQVINKGVRSLKVYMTYELWKLNDYQLLDVLYSAGQHGAMVMVHCENNEIIRWVTDRLIEAGKKSPKYHAVAHSHLAEDEATNRLIILSRVVDVPVLIVHMSSIEAVNAVRAAQDKGFKVYGETCPQYLFLTEKDIDKPGLEGAKFCCSPPPRDEESQQEIWRGLIDGTLEIFSSDHAPYSFDKKGKLPLGENTPFNKMANGLPGIEVRLPLLFSEGVIKKRITIDQFVNLSSTNHAKLYGMYPKKGVISIGSDADLAIWDPTITKTISWDMLHDNVGYTPYEGRVVTGWPVTVISNGNIIVSENKLLVKPGFGNFIACSTSCALNEGMSRWR